MKTTFFIFLTIFLVAPIAVKAQKKAFGNGLYWELNNGVLTISGNGDMPEREHPWKDNSTIGTIRKLIIENGILSIGDGCFSEMPSLTIVSIANTVTSIGDFAFDEDKKLSKVILPNSIKVIGENAFSGCISLSTIIIPQSVTSIERDAFFGSGLTTISIPNSVKSVGNGAFSFCSKLSSISIPNSVFKIGEEAFLQEDEDHIDKYFSGTIISMPQWLLDKGKNAWNYCGISESSVNEFKRNNTPEMVIKRNGGYASAVELKNGSTKYYKVSKSGRYGLTDSEGKEIVPCEMEALESAGTGYLRYKINGFWGVMNYTGKIIIGTERGYTSIGDFVTFTKRFPYAMTGWKGECDINGRQISKIKVETPKQTVAKKETKQNTPAPKKQEKEQTIIIEHHRDPVPMQQWQACWACGGMGTMGCDNCGGSGTKYIGDRLHICSRCNGRGIIPCNICYGNKGQYITVYR